MSSIDKMMLYGIRSFGPEERDKAVIKFSSPLTLILGQNGCGKTTIIEALKYATCGEIPGGTDGGSGFIHDPKLSGCIDVKGHVRLKCRDIKGEEVTVLRTALVTQKAKKLEFKSLDAAVTNAQGGTISGRHADIDALMSNILGVSKAVLTNVIFCHQEDSSWPLERGKKMKERFDAIFGITEYNKCLDHMRALAKKMETEKALLKKDVDHNSQNWEETREKRKKLEDTKAKLSASCDNVSSLERQIEPLESKFQEILEKEMNFVTHNNNVQNVKSKRQYLLESQRELKRNIETEFHGSKDELKQEIANFQSTLEDKERKLHTLSNDKELLIKEEVRLQKNISVKQMQLGTLQSEEEQNDKKIETRNYSMNKLSEELKLPIISSIDINVNSAAETLKSLEQKLKEENKALEKLHEDQEHSEKLVQSEIDVAREEKVRIEHDVRAKQKAIEDNKKETKKVEKEIEEVDKSAGTLAALERNLSDVNKKLDEVVKSLNVDEHKARIKDNMDERNRLEEKVYELDKEIKTLQKYSLEKANLDQLLARKRKREEEFEALKDKNNNSLKRILRDIPECDFKKKVEAYIDKISDEIRLKENSINTKEKELSILTEKKRNMDEKLKSTQREIAKDEDRIEECCGGEDFNDYINALKNKIDQAQNVKGTINASQVLFTRYIDKLKTENPLCPLCRRDFNGQEEIESVVEDLNRRLVEIPSKLSQTTVELEGLLERQAFALKLVPVYENISRMRDHEIPKMRKEVSELSSKMDKMKQEIETLKADLEDPQADKTIARNLLSDAMSMDHIHQELKKLQQEITTQEKKLPSTGSTKTLQEANDEQDEIKSRLNTIRKQLDSDQNAISIYNEKLSKLREQKNDITAKQMKIEGGVQQRNALNEKLEELQMMASIFQAELTAAENNLTPISEKLNNLTQQLRKMKIEHKIKLDEKKKKLVEYDKRLHEIKNLQSAIEEYNSKGGHSRLEITREDLKNLQVQKDTNIEQRQRIEKEMESINQFRHTQQVKKLDLENNLKLREKQEEMAKLDAEIAALEGQLGELNVENLRKQKLELKQKKEQLERQKSLAEGRQMELRNHIRELEYELNSERYKNAEQIYRKSVIALKVSTLATDDLKQYEKAMDWAMIYFHKERMKMINTIVRDLWRQIYSGNDIDTIEVKTDEAQSTAGGRRSYNYRVVQIKNGTELDMPGRCSAGQKVLACLIIRIALAETFSKNCGILALDEPTTNLDRQNIHSLSVALSEIVNKRTLQKNFQLLIITHDEEFLKTLTRVDKIDYYLEVKRNNRGKSEVHKVKV